MSDPQIIPVGGEPPPLKPTPPRPSETPRDEAPPKRKASRGGDRFGVLNRFVDVTLRRINPTTAAVWLVLFRDTKADGLTRTGQGDIARRIGRSVRTVYTALRKLERLGLLIVVRQGRMNAGATVYRLCPLTRDDAG